MYIGNHLLTAFPLTTTVKETLTIQGKSSRVKPTLAEVRLICAANKLDQYTISGTFAPITHNNSAPIEYRFVPGDIVDPEQYETKDVIERTTSFKSWVRFSERMNNTVRIIRDKMQSEIQNFIAETIKKEDHPKENREINDNTIDYIHTKCLGYQGHKGRYMVVQGTGTTIHYLKQKLDSLMKNQSEEFCRFTTEYGREDPNSITIWYPTIVEYNIKPVGQMLVMEEQNKSLSISIKAGFQGYRKHVLIEEPKNISSGRSSNLEL